MWIRDITLKNFKGFNDSGKIEFSNGINIIIGNNNAGKSSILEAIFRIQHYDRLKKEEIRAGATSGSILIAIEDVDDQYVFPGDIKAANFIDHTDHSLCLNIVPNRNNEFWSIQLPLPNGSYHSPQILFDGSEPNNLIYPFFSKRKVNEYDHNVNISNANRVSINFHNLVAKLDRILNPSSKYIEIYKQYCRAILGFEIVTDASEKGKRVGYYIDENNFIELTKMGEGVSHLIAIIVYLCTARNKVFLIEEIESDIHPKALKELLELIKLSARNNNNQFIMTTHSNIVLKILGSYEDCKFHKVEMELDENRFPVSIYTSIDNNFKSRRLLLSELGYDTSDYDVFDGWLFFEESSAELLFRNYFLKWYAPYLVGRVGTVSSIGITNVKTRFENFYYLILYTHLETVYRNSAWVIVDNAQESELLKSEILSKFKNYPPENFHILDKKAIELYYPNRFESKVTEVLNISDKEQRQIAKCKLLYEVRDWIDIDEDIASKEFEESASEIVQLLKSIETKIKS